MNKRKPYIAKSITGAQSRVRLLQKQVEDCHALLEQYSRDRVVLAKLAAEGPAFYNPIEVIEAKKIRDHILRGRRLNPDGSPMAR